MSVVSKDSCHSVATRAHGVWVPAFAGTTRYLFRLS
jgi:hypothetical protein